MSFVRPEAAAQLRRFREVLIGAGLVALGLWWSIWVGGLLGYAGLAVSLAGAALVWVGLQRARFRSPGSGLGVVQIDEDQITYFGPLTGGVVALSELRQLGLDGSGRPVHWRLDQPGQPPLMIPVDAEGAERLFDAFARLPGLRMEPMLRALRAKAPVLTILWSRDAAPALPRAH